MERLRLLDGMGRVWGQTMLLEVRGAKLLLTDSETTVSSIVDLQTSDKFKYISDGSSLFQDDNDPTQGVKGH